MLVRDSPGINVTHRKRFPPLPFQIFSLAKFCHGLPFQALANSIVDTKSSSPDTRDSSDSSREDEPLYDVWIVVAFAVPCAAIPYAAYAVLRR